LKQKTDRGNVSIMKEAKEENDNVIPLIFYSKSNQMHRLKFISVWNDTLHASDGLSVHHQEFKTVYTSTGIFQTDTAVCLLDGTCVPSRSR